MKNYFQKILALFTGNDYPGSTRQEFYQMVGRRRIMLPQKG